VLAGVSPDAFTEEELEDEFLMDQTPRLVVLSGVDDQDAERPAYLPEYLISRMAYAPTAPKANWDDMSLVDFMGFGKGTASVPYMPTSTNEYLSKKLLMLHQRRAYVEKNSLQHLRFYVETLRLLNRICGAWA
jgi:hypothetical protein